MFIEWVEWRLPAKLHDASDVKTKKNKHPQTNIYNAVSIYFFH